MFEELFPKIPLNEAAAFFYKVKYAGWTDPPDQTGELEGTFNVPATEVAGFLAQVITAKFKMVMAYYTYAETMRDVAQHSVGDVFHEHALHELSAAEYYLKRAAVLGGAVSLQEVEPPPASTDPIHIVQVMMRAEQEAIALQRQLKDMIGDANPMKVEVEEKLAKDQHHLDELWQMLPPELHDAAQGAMAAAPSPDAAPAPPAESSGPEKEAPQGGGSKPESGSTARPDSKEAGARLRLGLAMKLAAAPTDAELKETGRQRAVTGLAAEAHREKGRHGERLGETLGRAAGALGGAAAGRKFIGGRLGTVAGLAAGMGVGGKAGKELGAEHDVHKNAAAMKLALRMKLAYGPPLDEYMAAHQAGEQAQQQNEAEFYRGKLQEMQATGQGTQQQIADLTAQLQQAQEQQAQVGATIQAANEEAMSARDDAMQHAQMSANMRLGYQKIREQILQLASQDPETLNSLPTAMPPGSGAGMAPGMAEGMGVGQPGAMPQAGLPGEVPAGAGAEGAPGATQPANGQNPAPNPTAAPSSVKIGGLADYAGAIAGGALGAVTGARNALGKAKELPERAAALEGATQGHDGSFASALDVAKARAGVTESENAAAHPLSTALKGGLKGGAMGAAGGAMAQRLAGNLGQLFQ